MIVNDFELKDYIEQARELITEQFKDKPVFNKLLELLLLPNVDLQLVWKDLMQKRSIDTAEGAQLDILGALVGQPRTLIGADLLVFFGFFGDPQADSYGDYYIPGVGGVWWDKDAPKTGNVTLNDDMYRLLIKSKIAKNTTRATPEDLIRFANFLFTTKGSNVVDEGAAKFRMLFGKPLTKQEIGLLQYINREQSYSSKMFPKPIGVGIEFSSYDYDAFFAFQGVENAKGYGELKYTAFFDGTHIYDGSVIPRTYVATDENGVPIGGYWGTIHQNIIR